jgi:hypothetical protein
MGLYCKPEFRDDGVPVYNIDKAEYVANVTGTIASRGTAKADNSYVDGAEDALYSSNSKTLVLLSAPLQGYTNGTRVWTYHCKGIRQGDPPDGPGAIGAIHRMSGVMLHPPDGEAGEVFSINGWKGDVYMMTSDGLFVSTLFYDLRRKPLWRMPEYSPGTQIKEVSLTDEAFFNPVCQTVNGIYIVAGKEHSSVCSVEGWETVHRIDPTAFDVTAAALAGKDSVKIDIPDPKIAAVLYVGIRKTPPTVDGKLTDWDETKFVPVGAKVTAGMMVSGDNLYVAYKTGDGNLLANAGGQSGNFQTLFKTGGGLDMFIATDSMSTTGQSTSWRLRPEPVAGDIRLLVAQVNGETKAVLYQPVVAGTAQDQKIVFTSTIGQTIIDKISDVSSSVTLAGASGNFEYSIPLAALVIKSASVVNNLVTMGDVGILVGNSGQTVERIYWKNRNTSNVSDIPSEARSQPNTWGLIRFKDVADVGVQTLRFTARKPDMLRIHNRRVAVVNPLDAAMELVVDNARGEVVGKWPVGYGARTIEMPKHLTAGTYFVSLNVPGSGLLARKMVTLMY